MVVNNVRFSLLLIVAGAIACGTAGTDRPRDVRASATASGVEVTWGAAAGAAAYRVQLVDLDSGRALSDAAVVRGTRAVLPGAFSQSAGVRVDAIPGGRAIG